MNTGEKPISTLVVEDEEMIAIVTASTAEQTIGGASEVVGSAEDAQEAWLKGHHEMIILDVNLPGMNGHEFCNWLRLQERGKDPFVLFCTGENKTENFRSALDAGANDYILKSAPKKLMEVRLEIAKAQVLQTRRRLELASEVGRSEKRFRLISENSRDLVCTHSPDGTLTYVSPSAKNLTGFGPEDLLGKKFDDLKQNKNDETINLGCGEAEANGQLETTQTWEAKHADGSELWFETYSQATRGPNGEIAEIYSYSRDITEEKREEEQLRILMVLGEESDTQTFLNSVIQEIEEQLDAETVLHIHPKGGMGSWTIAGAKGQQREEVHEALNHATPPEKPIFQGTGAGGVFHQVEGVECFQTIISQPVLGTLGKPLGKLTICREGKTPESERTKAVLTLAASKIGCVLEEHVTR